MVDNIRRPLHSVGDVAYTVQRPAYVVDHSKRVWRKKGMATMKYFVNVNKYFLNVNKYFLNDHPNL